MALQYQPPPDWLMQEYVNRKNPIQQSMDSVNQLAQTYAGIKAQQQTQQLAQEGRDIDLAKLSSATGTSGIDTLNAIRKARGMPPLTIPTATPAAAPVGQTQVVTPVTSAEDQAQQSLPAEHGADGGSPIIAHWNASQAGGGAPQPGGKPTIPVVGSDPSLQEFTQIGSQAYLAKHGTEGMAKVKQALEIEKGMQDKKKSGASVQQYAALQSGDPKALADAFPADKYPDGIPLEFIAPSLSATARNVSIMSGPTGTPIRVSKTPGSPAEAVSVPGVSNVTNPIQSKLTPNEYKDWMQEVNQFDSDTVVKADRAVLGNLNQIGTEISKYNKSLTGPLRSQQARAIAREVGALTDSDVARQALDPSVIGRLKSWISVNATGEIPKDQLDLLKQTVGTIQQSAQGRITTTAQERATRKSNLYGGKVQPQDLMGSLNLPTQFSVPQSAEPPPANLPTIGDDAAFNALPSGTQFKDPSGTVHRKK